MNPLADFRFQIYTKLSYLTNNSHESFFCANILTVDTSVYANNKSNHINLLFCFALNITSSLNLSTADNLNDKLQFIGESAAVGRALTKTFIHNPLMLFEPSAIPLCPIWSYENKFSRPYMP